MFSRLKLFSKIHLTENNISFFQESSGAASKPTYSQLFFDNSVQDLLRKLTNVDLQKLFRPRNLNEKHTPRIYELMTTEQLDVEMQKLEKKKNMLLQIPPLVDPVKDEIKVIDETPGIDGFDIHHSKHVFIDTSSNHINEKRIIVVREPNGVLRTANREERYRINQIYFPINGRELLTPRMFEEENLKRVLEREDYIFILDRACAQFEPDDPLYHKIIEVTYEQINTKMHFEVLQSTRHFGSLTFYLVTHKKIENMLQYFLESDRLEETYFLIQLYHIIHPVCKSAELCAKDKNADLLKTFIELDACEKSTLNSALGYCLRKREEKERLELEIKKAHGLQ